MNYDWNLNVLFDSNYLALLLRGFGVTLALTVCSAIVGTPLGILMGTMASLGRFSGVERTFQHAREPLRIVRASTALVRWSAFFYIDVIRAIPLLLLILLAYYGLPVLLHSYPLTLVTDRTGQPVEISAFWTSVIALSVNLSAFIADLVRGSAAAVSKGSILAARALGMSRWLTWRRIVMPDVVREMLPGLTLLYITIWKMSTLCSVVAVYEVLHTAESIIQRTYRPLELYFGVAVLFVITIVPAAALARRLERTQAFLRRTA